MIIKEMKMYHPDLNVDRLIAFCALAAFIKVQLANRGYPKRVENADLRKKDPNLYVKPQSFFKNRQLSKDSKYNVNKGGFRNLR
jgi:hypothetical protein